MKTFLNTKILYTVLVVMFIGALLLWDHTHGGVPSHHLLNKKDLPAFSNWWGALCVPLLTWLMLSVIEKRESLAKPELKTIYGFFVGLLTAISISALFTFDVHDIPGYILMAILASSLFYPIYRAECILGFVLGMVYTFGGVLPVLIGLVLASIGFILHKIIKALAKFVS